MWGLRQYNAVRLRKQPTTLASEQAGWFCESFVKLAIFLRWQGRWPFCEGLDLKVRPAAKRQANAASAKKADFAKISQSHKKDCRKT